MREKGAVPSISRMRVSECNAYSSIGAKSGSMATRRCSYTAALKLKLVEYAERHGNRFARSPESGLLQCGEGVRYIE